MRSVVFLLANSVVFGVALDVNPPVWRGGAYSTTQAWDFTTDGLEVYADVVSNPFGAMRAAIHPEDMPEYDYDVGAWKWTNPWYSQSLLQIDTQPNWPNDFTGKKAWVQITWGLSVPGPAVPPYEPVQQIAMSDGDGFDGIFPIQVQDWQRVGVTGTIEWYVTSFQVPFVSVFTWEDEFGNIHFTEEDAPWGSLYVFPYSPIWTFAPLDSYEIYVSGIVVDTIAVPEPGMLVMMGLGALLMRKRRGR